MLSLLKISNIAVIENAEIEFAAGLNILSGETGAGKSIVLDSLGAVLGFRTSRELIRTGAQEAFVTAVFTDVSLSAKNVLTQLSIPVEEDGSVIISRVIGTQKNLCRVNGIPVTVSSLRELGAALVSIHGQQDNRELLDSSVHLAYIDRLAGREELLVRMSELYRSVCGVEEEIRRLTINEEEKSRLVDLLSFEIEELRAAKITPGEEESLKKRRERIRNSEKLSGHLLDAYASLNGGDYDSGAVQLLKSALFSMRAAQSLLDEIQPLCETVEQAVYSAQSAAEEIRDMRDGLDAGERELAEIEERLDLLYRLSLKYGRTEADMLAYLENAEKKLEAVTFSQERLAVLHKEKNRLYAQCVECAASLTEIRRDTAREFASRVTQELEFLNMPYVRFAADITDTKLSETGADAAEFLISANKGEALKPMAKIASGGELSRIMLAIKSVLSSRSDVDTLIFDEIDQGVSGRAALRVGEKLASAASDRQLICVTHLAQIAAFADTHFLIEKRADDKKTYTSVTPLDDEGRRRELARITSGGTIGGVQLENAGEMLRAAREIKKG